MPRLKAFKWDAWADERFERFLQDEPDVVAIDTETHGSAYYDAPFCVTLSWRGHDDSLQSAYIALEDEFGGADPDTLEHRLALVSAILSKTSVWVFHNAKFDLQKLELVGALPKVPQGHRIEDTQAIFHLLDENSPKGLKPLAVSVLKWDDTISVPYKSGKKKGQMRQVSREKYQLDAVRKKLGLRKEDGYYWIPREVLVPYAKRDTDFTLLLYEKLKPKFEALEDERLDAMYQLELDLIDIFLRLESHGFAVDVPYLDAKTSEWGERLMELELKLGEIAGDPDINPNAWQQLLPVLQKRGVNVTDTQESTLSKFEDEFAVAILDYREAKKIHGTYLTNIQAEQRDGIMHPWFNTIGPRTGRMSSSTAHE